MFKVGDFQARDQFVTAIRNDYPIWELAHYIENLVKTEPTVSDAYQRVSLHLEISADRESTPQIPSRPIMLHTQFRFVHAPIVMGSKPWTIHGDDEMVSHLLSLFFTWQQPSCQYIDKPAFLADMAAGTVGNKKFCSALLVNAMLAQACSISPRRAECQMLQDGFFREAKRLLELEYGKATLSTMQALLVMHSIECNRGKDRLGRVFHHQAVDMYRRLGYASEQPRPVSCDTSETIQQEWRALTRIIWATFCHNGLNAFLYGFAPDIKIPLVEQYFLVIGDTARPDLDARDGYWTPYPIPKSPQPSLLSLVLQAQCILAQIFYDFLRLDQPPDANMSQDEARIKIRNQLHQMMLWKEGLDQRLRVDKESMAHVYHLDIWYHTIYVIMANYTLRWPESEIPTPMGSPQELLFNHVFASMESVWQYRYAFSFQYSAGICLLGPLVTSYSLIPYLRHRADMPDVFSRAVQALREHGHLEIIPLLMAGLRVLERRYSTQMPQEVQGYMKVLDGLRPDMTEVHMEMRVIAQNFGDFRDGEPSRHAQQFESMSDLLKGYSGIMMEQLRPGT